METLTAEVRVLMVGSRQVTLSVAKQLDRVAYEDMDPPLGRIRTGRKIRDDDIGRYHLNLEIIGRHRKTGALVYGYPRRSDTLYPWPSDSWEHWAFHETVRGLLNAHTRYKFKAYNGFEVHWQPDMSQYCAPCIETHPSPYKHYGASDVEKWLNAEWKHNCRRGNFCSLDDLYSDWNAKLDKAVDEYLLVEASEREAKTLPLIVLAGLK